MFDPRNRSNPNYILELNAKLQRNKQGIEKRTASIEDRINARTAAAVKDLQDIGCDRSQISRDLKLHPYLVDTELARTEKERKETRRFLATGQMPREGGVFTIYQR